MRRDRSDQISKIPAGLNKMPVSSYRVYIPSDMSRDDYIYECKSTQTISVKTLNGEHLHGVKVGKLAIDLIEFPKNKQELGSMVLLGYMKSHNNHYVLDVFDVTNEAKLSEEGQINLTKSIGDNSASVLINGKDGFVNVNSSGGGINISVSHPDNSGKLKVTVNGDSVFTSSGKTEIKSFDELKTHYINSDGESTASQVLTDKKVNIDAEEIIHNEGEEPMVLGNILKDDVLDALFDLLINTKVATSIGLQPFVNLADYASLKPETKNILSQYSFLK